MDLFVYPDRVTYERMTGKDKSLNATYAAGRFMYVKYVKGKDVSIETPKGIATEHRRLYRSPVELFEGDKIDGYVVINVEPPTRDVFNNTLAYKVWVK